MREVLIVTSVAIVDYSAIRISPAFCDNKDEIWGHQILSEINQRKMNICSLLYEESKNKSHFEIQ